MDIYIFVFLHYFTIYLIIGSHIPTYDTLWLFNIAMENAWFSQLEISICKGFSMNITIFNR